MLIPVGPFVQEGAQVVDVLHEDHDVGFQGDHLVDQEIDGVQAVVARHPAVVGIDPGPRLLLQDLPRHVRKPVVLIHKHALGGGPAQEDDDLIGPVIFPGRGDKAVIINVKPVLFGEDIVGVGQVIAGKGQQQAGAGAVLL